MKLLRIILCLVLAAALLGCTALADDVSALAGTYLLDASPLGMPLTVYLIIGEDGTFRLTNKPEGGADKGGDCGADACDFLEHFHIGTS